LIVRDSQDLASPSAPKINQGKVEWVKAEPVEKLRDFKTKAKARKIEKVISQFEGISNLRPSIIQPIPANIEKQKSDILIAVPIGTPIIIQGNPIQEAPGGLGIHW